MVCRSRQTNIPGRSIYRLRSLTSVRFSCWSDRKGCETGSTAATVFSDLIPLFVSYARFVASREVIGRRMGLFRICNRPLLVKRRAAQNTRRTARSSGTCILVGERKLLFAGTRRKLFADGDSHFKWALELNRDRRNINATLLELG